MPWVKPLGEPVYIAGIKFQYRQVLLLRLLASDCKNAEISHELNLTENSVKTYLNELAKYIKDKTGMKHNPTRTGMVAWYVRNGEK